MLENKILSLEERVVAPIGDFVDSMRPFVLASRMMREMTSTQTNHGTYIDDVGPYIAGMVGLGTMGWVMCKDWINVHFRGGSVDRGDKSDDGDGDEEE